ncbi:MAG: hypothetical protein COZ06_35720 [Armatimonadetes bacterium CG_4_10_14_3_um_filter_66_18]|nr:hypothetical protein [Armatimonadota bacterium]OIP05458.1 MAG: hypothetical protein AUJ96_10790 [Armatimonadetes bacterium CG2_30_66_41]PIU92973.1 MAG: hypothetical protein COS65_15160 [Armatimonadetes bacterium CG06_land_8_20_14_3_00_66_21]PIW18178.1 MAG: hypothetical protein COW34_04425 [Armatimonadetes bacterium CG17_big_fil_post_rev_8_21_14_2_50_66_6]PIX42570.1 MAG: hypothetical protein COZ57_21000 [Armatimonadetes bacterium CG_4_8_14_3_um_filter_66_20]PIY36587.1 MAG: hypothetical prote
MSELLENGATTLGRRCLCSAGWTAAFLLFLALTPLKLPPWAALPALYLTAVVGACGTAGLLSCFTRTDRDWSNLLVGVCVCALLIGGANCEAVSRWVAWASTQGGAALPLPSTTLRFSLNALLVLATNVFLVGAAVCGGELVAKGLRAPSYLVMAAVVAAIADTFSVSVGPTSKLAGSETALRHLALHWPALGGGGVIPIIGVGDFLFLSIFLVGAVKFGLGQRRNLVALSSAFAVGIACTLLAEVFFSLRGLPALPFMCVAFLLANRSQLRLTPKELCAVVKVSVMFAGFFAALGLAKALHLL